MKERRGFKRNCSYSNFSFNNNIYSNNIRYCKSGKDRSNSNHSYRSINNKKNKS